MKKIATPRLKTLVAATMLGLAMNDAAALFVDNTADTTAPGTLRTALLTIQGDTSCLGAPYLIAFAITAPPTGPIVFQPGSPYPDINCPTTIDGYTQSGSAPNNIASLGGSNATIRIVIDGVNATGAIAGLNLTSGNSVVQGLSVVNFASGAGLLVSGAGSKVAGNFIGVLPDGSGAGNLIGVDFGFGNGEAGGLSPSDRNVVSSNGGQGIKLGFGGSARNNLVGVAPDGVSARGNGSFGISTNLDGGLVGMPSAGNRIAFNQKGIVSLSNFNANWSANEIYSNTLIGIDLCNDGANPNDLLDGDSGTPNPCNGLQNSPVITGVTYAGGNTNITATLNTNASSGPYSIDIYDNDDALGQGKFATGCSFTGIATDASGNNTAPINFSCAGIIRNSTAITKGPQGASEFSAAFLTPQISPSASTLTFPTTAAGGQSSPLVLNINNGGTAGSSLTIDAIANSGPAEFYDTTGGAPPQPPGPGKPYCGLGSDAAGAPQIGTPQAGPCTLNLAFRPQVSGSRTAALTFTDANSPTSTISVLLTGVGGTVTPPATSVSFNPASLNLPGPTPALSTMSIAIANLGNGATFTTTGLFSRTLPTNLVIANPVAVAPVRFVGCSGVLSLGGTPGDPNFGVTNVQVPAGGSCTIEVDVTSSVAGSYPVTVATGDISGQVALEPVTTIATIPTANLLVNPPAAPAVLLSPSALDFGSVTVSTSSPPQTVTLTNGGSAPLVLGALASTGDYAPLSACPVGPPGLPPLGFCDIEVTFTPTLAGTRPGSITIPSNATPSTNTIALTGIGTAAAVPVVSLSASAINFPAQSVGTTSSPQVVTLTNTGPAPLLISSIVATPADFAVANGCPATLPAAPGPGNSCQLTITFSPLIAGARIGDVKIFDNASGSPHIVTLSGTATAAPTPTPQAPTSVSFPPTQVGTGFGPVPVTLGNSGLGVLTVSSVLIVGGGYTIASDACTGASLPQGATCVVTVNFAPTLVGPISAQLRFITNAPVSAVPVTLSGSGTASPIGTLSASPGSLLFGTLAVGATSAGQTVAVTNAGSAPVIVSGVAITGDFAQTNDCSEIPGGGSCTVTVTFTPTVVGGSSGSVTITSNATNPQLTIGLSGTGSTIPEPVIELSASSLAFGNRLMGAAGAGQFVTLKNVGGANLVISRIYATGDFAVTHNCTVAVTTGASCRLDITFTASVPGPRGGSVVIESNALGGTEEILLSGSACRFFSPVRNRSSTLLCQ